MKTPSKHTLVILALAAFTVGLFAGETFSALRRLPPLSGEDRVALVAQFERWADACDWWAEYYAINDWERAFRAGEKQGMLQAAYYLETYRSPIARQRDRR